MIICVSGTPASGKTYLSKKISFKLKIPYLDLKKFIKANSISDGFDKSTNSFIVDVKKLNKLLINHVKGKSFIIDSHLSHFLPSKYVDLCIITKCNLKVLNNRLKKRRYSKAKIKENLDAEIFDVCLNEAKELNHNVLVVDNGYKLKDLVDYINDNFIIKSKAFYTK